jgi:transposase-like protein
MNEPKGRRGKPQVLKDRAILLYTMCSASLRSIGKLLGVSTVTVLRWIRQYADTLEPPKIPSPADGTIIVFPVDIDI